MPRIRRIVKAAESFVLRPGDLIFSIIELIQSAIGRSEKQREEVSRRAAPDARERIPTGAGGAARSYHFYGACQRSTLTN